MVFFRGAELVWIPTVDCRGSRGGHSLCFIVLPPTFVLFSLRDDIIRLCVLGAGTFVPFVFVVPSWSGDWQFIMVPKLY